MNKPTLLLLLLALVAGLGVLAWSSGGAPLSVEAMAEVDADEPAVDIESARADADRGPETASVPDGLETLSRESVEGAAGTVDLLTVQVFDGKPGVPAAAVEVRYLADFPRERMRSEFAPHRAEFAETRGQRYTTDATGKVEVPRCRDSAIVVARRPGAFAVESVRRGNRSVTLTLIPDETVTVRCLDERGRPVAGVPVGIVQTIPFWIDGKRLQRLRAAQAELTAARAQTEAYLRANPSRSAQARSRLERIERRSREYERQFRDVNRGSTRSRGRGREAAGKTGEEQGLIIRTRTDLRARRRTGADGLARFHHFQLYRRNPRDYWRAMDRDRFQAVLLVPLAKRPTAKFQGRPVPREPVDLVLPPTGSIVLRTVDAAGRPFTHPVRGRLEIVGAKRAPGWARRDIRKVQNETEIEFPFVGLGLTFAAQCRLDDDDFRWTSPAFPGPTEPGERVVVDLRVAPAAGMLSGRLVDPAGEPLANVAATFLINSLRGRLEGEDVTVDGKGRFHLPYELSKSHRGPFHLQIRQRNTAPLAGVALPLPNLPSGRITDLGDLTLATLPPVAHGLVLDDRDQAIPGARIQLQRMRDLGAETPKQRFVDEAFVEARSDAEGHFALYGELEPGRYRLRVRAENHFEENLADLTQGAAIEVRMQRRTKVVGTVLLPEWLPEKDLKVRLTAVGPDARPRDAQVVEYRRTSYVYFDWVRPGVYDLEFRLAGLPDPILQIPGIRVEPGVQTPLPRLLNLDFRGLIHRYRLTAVDEFGQPVKPDWPLVARITRTSGEPAALGYDWKANRLEIRSTAARLDVLALATGFRAASFDLAPGPNQIQFSRIPAVELRLPGLQQEVGATRVWIRLQQVASQSPLPDALLGFDGASGNLRRKFRGMRRRGAGALLDRDDSARIQVFSEGSFRVQAYLLPSGGMRRTRPILVELGDLRLPPGAGTVRRVVPVDAKAVRAGLQKLRAAEAAAGPGQGR